MRPWRPAASPLTLHGLHRRHRHDGVVDDVGADEQKRRSATVARAAGPGYSTRRMRASDEFVDDNEYEMDDMQDPYKHMGKAPAPPLRFRPCNRSSSPDVM